MITKKEFLGDGSNTRFLSDFIIRSDQYCRPYVYVYDNTLNPDGSEDVLQTPGDAWSYPTNLYRRGTNTPKSEDLATSDKWQIVDNSVLFYTTPLLNTGIWIEVATTSEEFGSTLTAPSVERAEEAATNSQNSAVASAASALTASTAANNAGTSETNSAASEASASISAGTATTKAAEALASATAAGLSETASAASELAAGTSETNSAASEAAAGISETASALSEVNSAASEAASGISETNSAVSAVAAANSASAVGEVPGVINNGAIQSGSLALATTEVTGSIPILYTGNGTSKDVPVHGDVIGGEKVINGSFTSDISGWVVSTGIAIWESGRAKLTDALISQDGLTVGAHYVCEINVETTSDMKFQHGSNVVSLVDGNNEFSFIAGGDTYYIGRVSTGIQYVDNISIKEVSPMQIANDNGDGVTLAADWVSGNSYVVGDIVIDNSNTGDALAYRCITVITSINSPRHQHDYWNEYKYWVQETNQYGGRFWFKNRDAADDNKVFDSIRRELNNVETNTTAIEASLANSLTAMNVSSLSVGSDVTVNTNLENYVVWVDQTTRKTAGYRTDAGVIQNSKNNTGTDLLVKDSAGNPIIEHYNPTTGFSIIMDTGNGVAGRSIPHSLQSKPSFFTKKRLTTTVDNWVTYNKTSGAKSYLYLDATNAIGTLIDAWSDTEPTDFNYTVGTEAGTNANTAQYISYLQADSANHHIGSYTGSGAAGNVIDLGLDMTVVGSYVMIKKLSGPASWMILDSLRVSTINEGYLFADTSAAEVLTTNYVDFTSTGIILNVAVSDITNTLGSIYLIQAYSPKYAQPTGGSLIDVNAGVDLTYTQGIGLTNIQEATTAHSVDLSSFAGDKAYVLKERGSNVLGVATNLLSGQSRPLDSGSNQELVINGTFDVDTIGWSAFASTLSNVVGNLRVTGVDTIDWGRATQYLDFVIGETYIISGTITDGTCLGEVNLGGTTISSGTGDFSITYTAVAQSLNLILYQKSTVVGEYADFDNISIVRVKHDGSYLNTLDKLVYNSSDIATDLVALGECNVDESGNAFNLVEYEPLQSYFNDIVVEGEASLNKNVKIVDFGTVFNNNRYVLDNPFGNENYEGCITILQLFSNGKWYNIGESASAGSATTYCGAITGSLLEGIVVQTALNHLVYQTPNIVGLSTSGDNTASYLTSAPCRVIVTKIGDATDA